MKSILPGVALCVGFAASANAQFTQGNLAVARVGDGVAALAGNAAPVVISEYTTAGGLVNNYALPDTGASAFVVTGNATAEGALSLSGNGSILTMGGYNIARPFGTSPAAGTAAAVPRAIGTLNYAGSFALGPTSTTAFSGNGFRSAVTDNGNNYWGIANGGGTYYFGTTAAAGTIAANPANNRVMNMVNNNIYFSTGSGSVGIYGYSGTPTAASIPTAIITTAGTGTGTASPYDFAFNVSLTLAYVADDRTIANGGGIQRWDFNGSSWTLTYTLNTGSTGARGLAVDFSGADPVLYGTGTETSNTRLFTITDTGAGSAVTLLANAGANRAFRGLEFAPTVVPEPTTYALMGIGAAGLFIYRRRKS